METTNTVETTVRPGIAVLVNSVNCGNNEDIFAAARRHFGDDAVVVTNGMGGCLDYLTRDATELAAQGKVILGHVSVRPGENFVVVQRKK